MSKQAKDHFHKFLNIAICLRPLFYLLAKVWCMIRQLLVLVLGLCPSPQPAQLSVQKRQVKSCGDLCNKYTVMRICRMHDLISISRLAVPERPWSEMGHFAHAFDITRGLHPGELLKVCANFWPGGGFPCTDMSSSNHFLITISDAGENDPMSIPNLVFLVARALSTNACDHKRFVRLRVLVFWKFVFWTECTSYHKVLM